MRRRALLGAAWAAPLALARAHGAAATDAGARAKLLAEGEQALARGDASAALAAFERAAAAEHAPDIELGIVRSLMQAGDYRRALAFASHVAGAHRDAAQGAACYAWLLHIGGQREQALRVLQQARGRAAPGVLLDATEQRLADPSARPFALPLRLAPYALGEPLPADARLQGTALLAHDGRHALAPLAAVGPGRKGLWVRDGLGRSSAASVERSDASVGVARLVLARPLGSEPDAVRAPPLVARDAFPGAPVVAVSHAGTAADAAWPLLQPGFAGGIEGASQRLGIRLDAALHGGPVLDMAGRLVGLAARLPQGDVLVAAGRLRPFAGGLFAPAPSAPPARLPLDELYERGLRWTLQLLGTAG